MGKRAGGNGGDAVSKKSVEDRYGDAMATLAYLWSHEDLSEGRADVADAEIFFSSLMAERREILELISRIDEYDFECEDGPMKNCVEWVALKKMMEAL